MDGGKPSPGGATELSPALQRWEEWQERFKSRRDGRVLTHTLRRWLFAGGAPAPHCPHLLRHDGGERGEHIIRIPADHSDGSNDDHQNHRQHHRVLSDVLTLFISPQFFCQICWFHAFLKVHMLRSVEHTSELQ